METVRSDRVEKTDFQETEIIIFRTRLLPSNELFLSS
jgi:hypothetical protein